VTARSGREDVAAVIACWVSTQGDRLHYCSRAHHLASFSVPRRCSGLRCRGSREGPHLLELAKER
jgi:hypothetical protein